MLLKTPGSLVTRSFVVSQFFRIFWGAFGEKLGCQSQNSWEFRFETGSPPLPLDFVNELVAKRLDFLQQAVPSFALVGLLVNPANLVRGETRS